MYSIFPANTDVTLTINFTAADGSPMAPQSALYRVLRAGEVLITDTIIALSVGDTSAQITVDALTNTVRTGRLREMIRVEVEGDDSNGDSFWLSTSYVIEVRNVIEPGLNAAATWDELMLEAVELPELSQFFATGYSDADRRAALTGAWLNILQMPLSRDKMGLLSEDQMLSAESLAKLTPEHLKRLCRTQLIEADHLMGGNPIEDRRRAGMISDSAGESAHFFRSGKPLQLPICQRAARELGPLLNWGLTISRK